MVATMVPQVKPGDGMHVGLPGMCIVVIVVVVIRVVVVSSSMGSDDMALLDPITEEELEAVVRSPGDMTVAVDPVCLSPGTACVGLVVVPAEFKGEMQWSNVQSSLSLQH